MDKIDKIETDCIWVILKKVGLAFFTFMANRLDKGRFFFFRIMLFVMGNDNFISKGIPHYHFRALNS